MVYPHEKVMQQSECQLWPAGLSTWEGHSAVREPTVICWCILMRRSSSIQNANNCDLLVYPPENVIQQSEYQLWPAGLSPWEGHPAVRMPTLTCWFVPFLKRSSSSQNAYCDLLVCPHEKVIQQSECLLWPSGLPMYVIWKEDRSSSRS